MTNEDKALWITDNAQSLIRELRRRWGLDPVWYIDFEEAMESDRPLLDEVYEDILKILDYIGDEQI